MPRVPDFSDAEIWTLEQTLRERWGAQNKIELQFADSDVRLSPGDRETTECPAIIWKYQSRGYAGQIAGQRKRTMLQDTLAPASLGAANQFFTIKGNFIIRGDFKTNGSARFNIFG